MKIKKILSGIGLLLLASSIIIPFQTKADKLDFTDLFSGGNPLSDDSYVRLLNEYDTSRGYADTSDIECSDDSNLKISFSILDDADLYTVRFYHLVVSPYRMEQLRNGDQSIDMSKIIMKEINRNSSKKVSYNISEIEGLNRNQAYYGFLVPTDDYDTVGTPSKEIVIPLDSAEYEPTDIICQAKTNRFTLKPGLNTFSTPAIIKSITFSNGGDNISFAKMEKGKWTPVTFTNNNVKSIIRPLDGFIIRNSNSTDITMTIEYDTDIDINDALHQKQLDAGWNFLGITKTNNPFGSIANAIAMDIIDFTIGNSNKIDLGNLKDATSFMLGKAYGVFVNNSNGIYGGRNNQGNNQGNNECIGMNQANVRHSIENGTIIFNWDQIQGDSVTISIFDDERGYVPLGTVNMDEREFRYQITARGEHRFLLSNGCDDFYYTVNFDISEAYSQELIDATHWAEANGIIPNNPNINNHYLYGALDHIELADIMNKYAENVLNRIPDTSKSCSFDDFNDLTNNQKNIVRKSCQLGLIPRDMNNSSFWPYHEVTRAVFGTVFSRALWGDQYEGGEPYYANHLNALKAAGIMNQINNPEDILEIKGYVLLMLMRASVSPSILTNSITRTIEFPTNGVTEKTVFNGDYTAEEDFILRGIYFSELNKKGFISGNSMNFSVYINGEEVNQLGFSMGCDRRYSDFLTCDGESDFGISARGQTLSVNKGDTINIQIKAEFEGGYSSNDVYEYNLSRRDVNYNNIISMNLAPIKIVENQVCGNGIIEEGENCLNCAIDAGEC